jgi:hypothetical protein
LAATSGFIRLVSLQDRIVFNLFSHFAESKAQTSQIYKRERILKLEDLYRVKTCETIYRILNNGYLPSLHERLLGLVRDHTYNTRQRNTFMIPIPEVRAVKLNFLYQAVKCWNMLSQPIIEASTASIFRHRLQLCIIESY